jgi:hypothetical protein
MYNHSVMQAIDGSLGVEVGRYFESLIQVVRTLFVMMLASCSLCVAYVLYVLTRRRIAMIRSPLRNLPGPENAHWFRGNFVDVREQDSVRLQEEWVRTYGHVLKYYSSLAVCLFPFLLVLFSSSSFYSLDRTTFIWPFFYLAVL